MTDTGPVSDPSGVDFGDIGRDDGVEVEGPSPLGDFTSGFNTGYVPVLRGRGGGGFTGNYMEGDEFSLWDAMSDRRKAETQLAMIEAGVLSESRVPILGQFGGATIRAFGDLLGYSNETGMTWSAALSRLLSDDEQARRSGPVSSGRSRAPLQVRTSNPDDLKAAFRQAARRNRGGVFIDEAQLDSMVASYQEKEAAAQRAAYSGAATVEAPPSAGVFAEAELEGSDPGGAVANRFASMTSVLMSLGGAQ